MSVDLRARQGAVWRRRGRADRAVGGGGTAPAAPTGLTGSAIGEDTVTLSWTPSTTPGIVEQRIYLGGTRHTTIPDGTTTSAVITGLSPGTDYTWRVSAYDGTTNSPWSAPYSMTTTSEPEEPPSTAMLMGCSSSNNDHGGTEVWDGWRCYTRSALYQYANRTGSQRPQYLAYSEAGANLSGSYASVLEHCLDELDDFYYSGSNSNHTGGTQSGRWGIALYWSNGNENYDKGDLSTPHTTAGINAFVESQRALYDAVHFIDPGTGQRRYPDAYAGSNPTQNAEFSGLVEAWLHPSARYHDFVMWSMYPPGRQSTTSDPTFNWPSTSESARTNRQNGFLVRCFYRTAQARAAARAATGNPSFPMMITCGEVGIGDDPDDPTTRPYYAVHALARGMRLLSAQYDLPMPFATWWDNQVDAAAPQNILSDEAPTTPSTREAWQNPLAYDHTAGGTHPASWAGNPKAGWKTTGTPV